MCATQIASNRVGSCVRIFDYLFTERIEPLTVVDSKTIGSARGLYLSVDRLNEEEVDGCKLTKDLVHLKL